jgi:hypothetical protein
MATPLSLPPELQFNILLDLSYEQIIQYCQTNTQAKRICQSEYFWNLKALQEYGYNINLIAGPSPSARYFILSKILSSEYPFASAIIEGQLAMIELLWPYQNASELYNELISDDELLNLIIKALKRNEYDVLGTLDDILNEKYNTTFSNMVMIIYYEAVVEGHIDILPIISDYGNINYIALINDVIDDNANFKIVDALIQDAIQHGKTDIVSKIVNELIDLAYERGVINQELLKNILNKYYQQEEIFELFKDALDECPLALFFSQYFM